MMMKKGEIEEKVKRERNLGEIERDEMEKIKEQKKKDEMIEVVDL